MGAGVLSQSAPFPIALIADASGDVRDTFYTDGLGGLVGRFVYAGDGRDALVKACANPPSVLITEGRLPLINGYDLCALLRADAATRAVPVILVTLPDDDIQRAELVGADAVLVKPCSSQTLQAALQQLVLKSRTQRNGVVRDRRMKSRDHERRATSTPPAMPRAITCPCCDRLLRYVRSEIGGVSAAFAEQWDYFRCDSGCGTFQYRHRTRKLREV